MTGSGLEPLQHPFQLCVLELKFARQLVPEQPDLFIKADCIVRNGGNAWRGLRNDFSLFRFPKRDHQCN